MTQTFPFHRSLLNLIHLSDSALPVGHFAHSFGLETSIQDGRIRDGKTLKCFLDAELKLRIATSDLPLLRRIHRAAVDKKFRRIQDLDRTVGALKHAKENRLASLQMGRSLLDLSIRTTPTPFLKRVRTLLGNQGGHYLSVLPCVMASRQLPSDFASLAYCYGYLTSRISVAVRLIPMGQTEGQNILVSLFPLCNELLSESAKQESLSDFSGICDIQMMRHENLETRTFKS